MGVIVLSVVGQRLKNLYVNYDIFLTTKIIFLILYLRIKNHAIHYCSKLPKNNNDGKMNDILNTSFSIDDPVIFVTVTIFSMTSREALRSPALISMVDDVRFFINCNVLFIDARTFSVFCIPSSIMLSN